MDKQREKFEKWVVQRTVCKKYGAKLNQTRDGFYCDYRINDRWIAWQAAQQDKREFAEKVAKVVAERYHGRLGPYDIDEIIRKLEEE